jgi:glucose-6-phosphate 1-dehydrogenase
MTQIDTIVLFGATGDLARKMLFPALYRLEERGLLDQRIVGVALDDWSVDRFTRHVGKAVTEGVPDPDSDTLGKLQSRIGYVSGDYRDEASFRRLADSIRTTGGILHYLAIPPELFETVANGLEQAHLLDDGRLLVEKPFGRDWKSARQLNTILHHTIDESAIYRIDHFLGKEPVENLLAFRYANPILDAIWNRNYVDHIEITMAESFGVADRGPLYETLGVVRDVVQNHILQILCLLTMEAPVAADADAYADERVKVLRAMPEIDPSRVVYGQYDGYRDVDGVAPESITPTFVAFEATIDNPRWYGVPIRITAGKGLSETMTKAEVVFRPSPPLNFASERIEPPPNRLVIRIEPSDGVDLVLQTKCPGDGLQLISTPLSVDYEQVFGRIPLAYERVLHDALVGDRSQFAREDAVEEAWRIVDRTIDPVEDPPSYPTGSSGPEVPWHTRPMTSEHKSCP